MKKFLLAGAVVVFGGIAATVAAAADHKAQKHAAPSHATVIAAAPAGHKDAPKKHHAPKHKAHPRAHKHHAK